MSSFSSSWQTNAPHIPATLHSYAEQFDWVNEQFEIYGGWGLTEENYGSDAASLE